MDVISAKQAGELLGITARRIWQMLDEGTLHAAHEDPLLLHRSDVEHLAQVQPLSAGRPFAAPKVWDEISKVQIDDFDSERALDAWRRKMRPRAGWKRLHFHRSSLRELMDSHLLVASGLRAAEFHGVPVDAGQGRFIGYVAVSDLAELPPGIPVDSGDGWNVELGVVANDAWRFGRSMRFADPVTTWLDLEDHRHRAARLMLEVAFGTRD